MYQRHPSPTLNKHFEARPFQGAAPHESEFLFVGLDANYAYGLEGTSAFESVLAYHEDGVGFWRRYGVHHPFMLASYTGDGRRYHQNFAKIGFGAEDAHRISFTELLHVPTTGRSDLRIGDLDPAHLRALNQVILSGQRRHVFLSAGVSRLMQESGCFTWLRRTVNNARDLPALHSVGQTTVYQHLHFSNYGKFQERLTREAAAIRTLALLKTGPGLDAGWCPPPAGSGDRS